MPSHEYQHDPLESPERQIRLLSVSLSRVGGKVHYELKTYILGGNRTPHFYAISYEWGLAEPKHQIIIDGKAFLIRSNLRDCLERLGSAEEGFYRPVWIDAICIDQSNLAERNAQVGIMGSIYASAKLVLAWFGKQAPANGSLTRTVACLQKWQASQEYRTLVESNKQQLHSTTQSQSIVSPQLLSLADPYGPMWSCLKSLCEQPYWSRLWIVQEIIKAPKLLLTWGDEQIPWDVLSVAFHTIQLNKLHIGTSEPRFAPWDVIATSTPYEVWRQRDGPHPERSLLDLMDTYSSSGCSVRHDKAYALTGISTNSTQLQVDYEKSLPDLYVELMELVTDTSQTIKFSSLILQALGLDPHRLLTGVGAVSLRGHDVTCEGRRVGRVEATKLVNMENASVNVEVEVLELFLMASAILSPQIIDSTTEWARWIHRALREELKQSEQEIIFFWVSSNQLGAALATVPIGHSIYCFPGIDEDGQDIFMRIDDAEAGDTNQTSPVLGYDSPQLSSPTQSQSTFFSEPGTELATRVWLSPQAQLKTDGPANAQKTVVVQVTLADLVAMNHLLNIKPNSKEDSVPELGIRRQQTQSERPRRRSTRDSASISDVIDHVMDPQSARLAKSSTWPTHIAGEVFVDALSRDLRNKLFASDPSSLNLPE